MTFIVLTYADLEVIGSKSFTSYSTMHWDMMWPLISNLFKCQSPNCSKTLRLCPPTNPREFWCPLSLFSSHFFSFFDWLSKLPIFLKRHSGVPTVVTAQLNNALASRATVSGGQQRHEQQFWANSAHLFTSLGRHEATEARGKVTHTYTQKESRQRGWTAVEHIMLCKVVHIECIGCCVLHTKTIRRNGDYRVFVEASLPKYVFLTLMSPERLRWRI